MRKEAKIHEKWQKYTKNAQEKIIKKTNKQKQNTSQFNSIYISMAYKQNGVAFMA